MFLPTFQKHHGQPCGGVQIHVTDRPAFHSLMTAVALLKAAWRLWPGHARWRTHTYEFVSDPIAIDLLDGSPALRSEVENDVPLRAIAERWDDERAEFDRLRKRYLDYGGAKKKAVAKKAPAKGRSPRRVAQRPPVDPEPVKDVATAVEETLSP
jgi:hypothetical protein